MIYEYPEEFIIPVVYSDDLKEKSGFRHEDHEPLRDWKLLILDDELQGDKVFEDNKDINFLKMEVELLPKLYQESIFIDNVAEESIEDKSVKRILNDIDNEYADSETLRIHRAY